MKSKIVKLITALLCIGLCACQYSCASLGSAISGAPIPTVAVKRADAPDAKPFNVAAGDVAQAELQPLTVYGLYDAGQLASTLGKSVNSSSK